MSSVRRGHLATRESERTSRRSIQITLSKTRDLHGSCPRHALTAAGGAPRRRRRPLPRVQCRAKPRLPARRKRTGGLGLIEHDVLPCVILEDQKLRGGQQQGAKQRNQIGDFHETAPRVIHGAQCSPPAPTSKRDV